MKTILNLFLLILLPLIAFSIAKADTIKRKYYIRTPYGLVPVETRQDKKERKKEEFKEKYGREDKSFGVEMNTKAVRRKDGDREVLEAFIRGCGYIELQALSDSEKEQKTLDSIKNGDAIIVKMKKGEKCVIAYWEKIFK